MGTDLILGLVIAAGLAGLIAIAFVASRRWSKRIAAVNQQVEATFGLVNHNPKGLYPDFRGQMDGVEVAIDVIFVSYTRNLNSNGQRAVTRVRAQLRSEPQIQVIARAQQYAGRVNLPERPTEDPEFDARYTLYANPDQALEESFSAALRDALMAAQVPVHILERVVVWTHPKVVDDWEQLRQAVQDCVRVARAFDSFHGS